MYIIKKLQVSKIRTIIISILLTFIALVIADGQAVDDKPNIVIIFTDDLGYGDLSSYGHPTIRTPHIDQMADDGIRFTSFYSAASVCTPSRASLLTGRYPIRNLPHNLGPESKTGLPLTEITLAQVLKGDGYKTMAVGKWHLGHMPEYLPTARGFDSFYGLPYSNDMILPWCPWLTEADQLFLYENDRATKEIGYNQGNLTMDYTTKAVEFINTNADNPFFLYFAHSMPHLPISTSLQFIGKSKAGLYGDVIETIDWSVGKILTSLKENGLEENTIVIFTSDNGPWQNLPERMLQKGVKPWHSGSAGLLRGSKMGTYEGGFRVPAIIKWPVKISGDQVCDKVINTMDLFTTLIHLSGGKIPSDRVIDGRTIPILELDNIREEAFFYLKGKELEAIRIKEWKLRITSEEGVQLFNLDIDPSEKYNRAIEHPSIVNSMKKQMVEFATESDAKFEH